MTLSTYQRKKVRSTFELSEEKALHSVGRSCLLTIPKHYARALSWIAGKTVVKIILNQDQSLTIRAVNKTQPDKPTAQLPLPEGKASK